MHPPDKTETNVVSQAKVIRYKTKPDRADENERLIQAVFATLAQDKPDGLRYAAFRLDDGVSFVHVAVIEGEVNPLTTLDAFAEFQSEIGQRVTSAPDAADATVVGSYRFLAD